MTCPLLLSTGLPLLSLEVVVLTLSHLLLFRILCILPSVTSNSLSGVARDKDRPTDLKPSPLSPKGSGVPPLVSFRMTRLFFRIKCNNTFYCPSCLLIRRFLQELDRNGRRHDCSWQFLSGANEKNLYQNLFWLSINTIDFSYFFGR